MKITDLKEIKNNLLEIKQITDKEEYLVSSNVNQRLMNVLPLIDSEIERMESTGVEVHCMQIKIIQHTATSGRSFTDIINEQIKLLTLQDFKIIDCEIKDDLSTAIIKYTN